MIIYKILSSVPGVRMLTEKRKPLLSGKLGSQLSREGDQLFVGLIACSTLVLNSRAKGLDLFIKRTRWGKKAHSFLYPSK